MRKTIKPIATADKPKPRIIIDFKLVDKLLEAGCLGTEVAAACGCHPDTLYDRVIIEKGMSYSDYSAKMRAKGDSCLRAVQHSKAIESKDNTMLIWLGKQRLDQKEPETRSQTALSIDQLDSIKQIFEQISKLQANKEKAPAN